MIILTFDGHMHDFADRADERRLRDAIRAEELDPYPLDWPNGARLLARAAAPMCLVYKRIFARDYTGSVIPASHSDRAISYDDARAVMLAAARRQAEADRRIERRLAAAPPCTTCGAPAEMHAALGPACAEHYDDLSA